MHDNHIASKYTDFSVFLLILEEGLPLNTEKLGIIIIEQNGYPSVKMLSKYCELM